MSEPGRRIATMLFQEVAAASAEVTGTASRTAKVRRVAEALRVALADGPDTVVTVVSWLRGELRQRRTGLGWTALRDLPPRRPSRAADADRGRGRRAFARAAALSGSGSQTARRALLADLLGRATASERGCSPGWSAASCARGRRKA